MLSDVTDTQLDDNSTITLSLPTRVSKSLMKMYFGVKAWGFQGFFISVLLKVGQVQKTELSSHLKTLRLSVGGGALFTLSWLH